MSDILTMEAANLFCGDHDPNASKHLTLSELQLPALQEMFADHHAGGSRVQIEVPVGIQKLEPTFKLVGWDEDVLTQFGLGTSATKRYTAYGVLRSKRSGEARQVKAIIEGRIGKVEAETFKRGELQSHDYAINSVMHYEVYIDGKEKFYWDFYSGVWRVDSVDQNADERRLLNLPV